MLLIDLWAKLAIDATYRDVSPPKWPSTSLFDDFLIWQDSRRPPAELKVASELSGTLYAIISVLNANFYENINAHYKTHTFSMLLCQKNMFTWKKTLSRADSFTSVANSF